MEDQSTLGVWYISSCEVEGSVNTGVWYISSCENEGSVNTGVVVHILVRMRDQLTPIDYPYSQDCSGELRGGLVALANL